MSQQLSFSTNNIPELACEVVKAHYEADPSLAKRYGEAGKQKCIEDAEHHLTYLQQAVIVNSDRLFTDYALWAKTLLEGINIPVDHLKAHLQVMSLTLEERLIDDEAIIAARIISTALKEIDDALITRVGFLDPEAPLFDIAQQYLAFLLASNRRDASRLILKSVEEEHCTVQDIYLHVFQPVQEEVGRLWQTGQISVAQEHFCTAATQLCMSQLYPLIFNSHKHGGKAVVTCAQGELHEIGVRMVADLLEMNGWDSFYLGANVPSESVIDYITKAQPDLVGISATITEHIPNVTHLIAQIRELPNGGEVNIIVGGYPFNIEPKLALTVGANAAPSNAKQAVEFANSFSKEQPRA